MTRTLQKIALALLTITAVPAQAAPPIFGHWMTEDGSAIIRVDACGDKLCGWIDRVLDPRAPARDVNNSDRALRAKPLTGTQILSGFTGAGANWKGGRAYDPKSGNSYRTTLQLLGNGKLQVTGCLLFICRSQLWKRAP